MPAAASPAASGNSIASSIANCSAHGSTAASTIGAASTRACSRNPNAGTIRVTTSAVAASPSPRAHSLPGGALYCQAMAIIAPASAPGAVPARRASSAAATVAAASNVTAARSATTGASTPPGSTRLPPDQRVGVRLARSASRSK